MGLKVLLLLLPSLHDARDNLWAYMTVTLAGPTYRHELRKSTRKQQLKTCREREGDVILIDFWINHHRHHNTEQEHFLP